MPHKFVDLGITEKQDFDLESPSKPTNKKVFPSMHLHVNIPDELFKLDVLEENRAEIIFKVTDKGANENEKNIRKNLTIEIHKIKVLGKNKMTKDEFKKASDDERDAESERLLNV